MTGAADDIDICASYSRLDSAAVVPILDALKAHGITVWFDKNIPGGALWEETITRFMRKAKAVVFFASRASLESDRCFDEVSAARTLKRPIIPVLVERVKIPDELPDRLVLTLQTRNTIDAFPGADGDPVEAILRGLATFGIHPRTGDAGMAPAPAPVIAPPPAALPPTVRRSRLPLLAAAGVLALLAAGAAAYFSGVLKPAAELPAYAAADWCGLSAPKLLERAAAVDAPALEKAAKSGNRDAQTLRCLAENAACANGTAEPAGAAKAFEACERAGTGGNLRAVFNQGWMKQRGCGAPLDPPGALDAYNKASFGGCAIAQFTLGKLYNDGQLVAYDQEHAIGLIAKAAAQNYPPAMNALGNAYALGRGVPEDDAKAADLYRRAADLGEAAAALNYADVLERGTGVPANREAAIAYYRKAASLAETDDVKQDAEAALKRLAATGS